MWDWTAIEKKQAPVKVDYPKIKKIIYESEDEEDEEVKIEHREVLDDEEVVVVKKGGVVKESRYVPQELERQIQHSVGSKSPFTRGMGSPLDESVSVSERAGLMD